MLRDAGANWRFRQIVGDNAFELRNAATRAGARYFATPGALSRWLLWGESRSLARNTAAFRRRFRLQ